MNRWTGALLAPLLLGAAPQPLVVGVVHDQYGEAIGGALVQSAGLKTATDASGTFAFPGGDPSGWVVITCAYCRAEKVHYDAGTPVIAIVQRYDAIAQSAPTRRDYTALPYSSAASSVSLTPFAVLDDSASSIPGARVSMFGASPSWGGVTVDDGIPDYDVAAGASTFTFLPAGFVQHVAVFGPDWAFRYGDNAGSGTFLVDTRADSGTSATLAAGGQQIVRVAQNDGNFAASAGFASSASDSRDRIDATYTASIGDDTITAAAILAGSHDAPAIDDALDSAFNALRVNYRHSRSDVVQASLIIDNGGYNGTLYEGAGIAAAWSDVEADATLQTSGTLHGFVDAAYRDSTGAYGDSTIDAPVAGSIAQGHVDAGLQFDTSQLTASAGLGAFGIGYTGGAQGATQPLNARILVPSASVNYAVASNWQAAVSTGQWFRLPSLLQTYGSSPASLAVQKGSSSIERLQYGDLQRVRIEIMGVQGASDGTGGDFGWEIAPNFSLRAWTMHFKNVAEDNSGTVNALWTTYENPRGLRLDLIERRDELDEAPNQHFDGSGSVPLTGHVRAFAATERRRFQRIYEAGIQLVP